MQTIQDGIKKILVNMVVALAMLLFSILSFFFPKIAIAFIAFNACMQIIIILYSLVGIRQLKAVQKDINDGKYDS